MVLLGMERYDVITLSTPLRCSNSTSARGRVNVVDKHRFLASLNQIGIVTGAIGQGISECDNRLFQSAAFSK